MYTHGEVPIREIASIIEETCTPDIQVVKKATQGTKNSAPYVDVTQKINSKAYRRILEECECINTATIPQRNKEVRLFFAPINTSGETPTIG